jgi:ornithine cyclodeaminase/alanine dehydrogenase-like protein (mu-crystallin family)
MPILILSESDVRELLTMEMALEAVEEGLRTLAFNEAQNVLRARTQTDHAMLHVMSASAKILGAMGYKAYTTSRKGAQFHVGLFDGKTGDLLSILQADYLGQVRTGAASGVATKYLARQEASTVGLFGAGKQARTQLLAMCKVRKIKHVQVFSRTAERCKQFCTEMSAACKCPVEPVSRGEDAARNKDIVITATNSSDPVLMGEWLSEGTHLNVVGSNFISKVEIDANTLRRCKPIIVDSKEQARLEAGDFHAAMTAGAFKWSEVRELGQVLAGHAQGRTQPSEITLFKSVGIAIEDVATAAKVVVKAKEKNVGKWIDW